MTTRQAESQIAAAEKPRFPAISLRLIALILVVVGLLISGYLSYVQWQDLPITCTAGAEGGCETVQVSAYAELWGIKIAYLGLATYLVIGALLLLETRRDIPIFGEYAFMLNYGVVLFAFLYSMYLVYVQAFVLEAFCQWCLAHEVIMTLLFGVMTLRLWKMLFPPLADEE